MKRHLALLLLVAGTAQAKDGIDFKSIFQNIDTNEYVIERGLFNAIFAKELCSCLYVDGLTLSECKARDNLPSIAHSLVTITADPAAKTVSSKFNLIANAVGGHLVTLGPAAAAKYVSQDFGCVMTTPAPPLPAGP